MISAFTGHTAHRLVNSKFPPVAIFDDVASADEFEALYSVQRRTNPRIQQEVGQISLVPPDERPFGIRGCAYALAPFCHLDPDGSRFATGDAGAFYCANDIQTAISESSYHQQKRLQKIAGLKYDRLVMRSLKAVFTADLYSLVNDTNAEFYNPDDYTSTQAFSMNLRADGAQGIHYTSVRLPAGECYALFSPRYISDVVQVAHYEFIYDGTCIAHIAKLSSV